MTPFWSIFCGATGQPHEIHAAKKFCPDCGARNSTDIVQSVEPVQSISSTTSAQDPIIIDDSPVKSESVSNPLISTRFSSVQDRTALDVKNQGRFQRSLKAGSHVSHAGSSALSSSKSLLIVKELEKTSNDHKLKKEFNKTLRTSATFYLRHLRILQDDDKEIDREQISFDRLGIISFSLLHSYADA